MLQLAGMVAADPVQACHAPFPLYCSQDQDQEDFTSVDGQAQPLDVLLCRHWVGANAAPQPPGVH
jgi:hypothetical protein